MNNTFNLLIVDDDHAIRANLERYLSKFHKAEYNLNVFSAENCEQAKNIIKNNIINFSIIDINLPDENGFTFVDHINELYPHTKTAMITAYKIEDYLKMAKDKGVSNIIVKTAPFNFDELSKVVNGMLIPDKYIFGLKNYLNGDVEIFNNSITSSDSISKIQTILRDCMAKLKVVNIELLSIAILEAIMNAIYHAPRNKTGEKKYERGELIKTLENEDSVEINYAWDDEKLGISVRDNAGKLTKEDVLFWLERNMTGTNVLDTSGRGFYLMHCIVDRLIINIKTDEFTELIFLIYIKGSYTGHKPVYINQI